MMHGEKIVTLSIAKISAVLTCGLVAVACSSDGGTLPKKSNAQKQFDTASRHMIHPVPQREVQQRVTRASGGTQPDFQTITFTDSQQPYPHEHNQERYISPGERFARTLDAHNSVRGAHNLPALTWSSRLANYAQQWANRSAKVRNCGMKHRPNHGPYKQQHGENLWWASPRTWSNGVRELQDINIQRVVKDWADEKPFYNYAANTCKPGEQCGHYTQIVWRETKEVGCAYQQCADKSQLWVCNYSPAGNYIGERPY